MNITLLLDMAADAYGGRVGFGGRGTGFTYQQLRLQVSAGVAEIRRREVERVVFIAPNSFAFPVALFSAARAGVPFCPLSYRLGRDQLESLLDKQHSALVISEAMLMEGDDNHQIVSPAEWLRASAPRGKKRLYPQGEDADVDEDSVAILMYTSGTSAIPKQVILRHRHLLSYILRTVEFSCASVEDAALLCVPPYHIAGVSSMLSNIYAARRVVQLDAFSPESWLQTVREEKITHALLIPTMLARIVRSLEGSQTAEVPSLRSLAYGGAKMPSIILEQALQLFPDVDFVHAYGLTETSSTIALLGPEDHRAAIRTSNPRVRARLKSVGRGVPGVELEVRTTDGELASVGQVGQIWVKGEQVSGEYGGDDAEQDYEWFPTGDRGFLDQDGFLFVEGRADDTIIRGGENIAPAEIEEVIQRHSAVAEVAVVGAPDDEWGERIVAFIVPRKGAAVETDEIKSWTRSVMRSSKSPDEIWFREALPRTDSGKILRRQLVAELQRERS